MKNGVADDNNLPARNRNCISNRRIGRAEGRRTEALPIAPLPATQVALRLRSLLRQNGALCSLLCRVGDVCGILQKRGAELRMLLL